MQSNTSVIGRNSLWLSAEFLIDFVGGTVTSIAIARAMGPSELGYFVYIAWIANMSVLLGNVGIPGATAKYMAEYWGRNRHDVARKLYESAFRIQLLLACTVSFGGIVLVLARGTSMHSAPAVLLLLSVLPAMLNTMPSVANTATENLRANVPGSLVASGVYVSGVTITLLMHWGLTGVAAVLVLSRTAELLVRLIPVTKWMRRIPIAPLPPELRGKLAVFSGEGLILMVIGAVVWDRSEVFFLKNFYPDVRHVAFYSVAFSTAESVLKAIRVFTSAVAATMRVLYGRDRAGFVNLLPNTARYVALLAFPLYTGLAAVGGPAIRLAYGSAYVPVAPILIICCILAIPKAFLLPLQVFFQAGERQRLLLTWSLTAAVFNVLLDWTLIPRLGALGAAWANGLAQLIGVAGLWILTIRCFDVTMPWTALMKTALASTVMAIPVGVLAATTRPLMAILCGVPLGAFTFAYAVKRLGILVAEDWDRLEAIGGAMPRPLQQTFARVLRFLMPTQRAHGVAVV